MDERERPRVDYVEMARLLDAEVSYPSGACGLVKTLERQTIGFNLQQALQSRIGRLVIYQS